MRCPADLSAGQMGGGFAVSYRARRPRRRGRAGLFDRYRRLFAEVLASADAGAGEKVFGKCKACHKVDGTNGTGPHLDGVVNRAIGGVDGFSYSSTLADNGGAWTPEAIEQFLANPKGYAPGTKMAFAGLPKIEDRANVIAYLQGLGG